MNRTFMLFFSQTDLKKEITQYLYKQVMLTKVIAQAHIDHFTKWFERADKIVIVSHVSPDGDAIGSSLGLYHFLDSQDKIVTNG